MITVLTGTNSYALAERLNDLRRAFIDKYGKAGIESYSAEQLQLETLTNLVGGTSLFSTERLVIIKGLSEFKELADTFQKTMKSAPGSTHVILIEPCIDKRTQFYKILKKDTDFEEFNELNEVAAMRWIKEWVETSAGRLAEDAAETLIRFVGTDQLRLKSELEKLLAYSDVVSKESIKLLVEERPEETIFQLLEYALNGKKQDALTILEALKRAHEDPYQIASMLIWQVQILAIVTSTNFKSENEVVKEAKINPFVVKKTRTLAQNMGKEKIHTSLDALARLDVDLKSSKAEPWQLLEVTILKVG